ncbi:Protein CBG15905 [Caenorhabditis briggsae]|uniref:Protein CBG15905 n=1 Tax=Caenorhabditis briggsae TaxID=6238 RepID=A8XN15_CAEBR|nr:Protein CBG15905 [Caenorhabditis briggsae]CAP34041.2 Protein CBG15905 [Caenorhabditis briggsae]
MLKLLFLVFISWVQLIGAVVPDCKSGTIIFDPPLDRSTVTWYPRNFTNNAPLYPNNYNCTYQKNSRTSSSNSEFFYFIANGGKLKLSTGVTSANFGFSVLWKQYDNPTYAHKYHVSKSEAVPFSYDLYGNKPIVVEAETRVSATILPVNRYKTQYLRGIIYLDGPNFTSPCLGTGLQLLNGNTQFVSKGNFLTVLILGNSGSNPLLLFNDFYNMNGIKRFEAIQCDAICSEMKIDASKGRSVFQVDNGKSQYILQKMTGFGKLDVYAGNLTPEKRNLIASYDIQGWFTTFVMESGNCTISQTNSDAYSLNIDYGRKGIITSAEYGTSWKIQDVVTKMYAPGNAKFQYSVKSVDLKTWDSLEVVGRNDQQVTFRQK